MVDYTLDIAKEMGVENVTSIMLQDNYRALSLTKKMGFSLEYLKDGTAKGALDLREEMPEEACLQTKMEQGEGPKVEKNETRTSEKKVEAKQQTEAAA
jgi:hypothetical protein